MKNMQVYVSGNKRSIIIAIAKSLLFMSQCNTIYPYGFGYCHELFIYSDPHDDALISVK